MKRILIAEDEPHVIRVLKLALENAGYEVDTALNGVQALTSIKETPPDILITDIHMPQMTGEELCKRIEDEIPDRKFLIFILTSRTDIEHRDWSQNLENSMFLEKPVSIRKLLSKIDAFYENEAAL